MMNDEFEIVKIIKINGRKFAFKNKKTGKLSKKGFDYADEIHDGWAVVKIKDKYTFFNPSSGKVCKQKFDYALKVHENWAIVKINSGYTLFNPNIGKLCKQEFDAIYDVSEGWAKVKKDGKWTFFNPNTDRLCEQKFNKIGDVKEGWAVVEIDGKRTLFNPNTDIFCKHLKIDNGLETIQIENKFVLRRSDPASLDKVQIEKKFAFFNPENCYIFSKKFDNENMCSITEALKEYPEDFLYLPTAQFRDKDKIKEYLDAITTGIKSSYPEKSYDEIKQSSTLVAKLKNKIKNEKENIRLEDENKEKGNKEAELKATHEAKIQQKKEIAIKFLVNDINDLEGEL